MSNFYCPNESKIQNYPKKKRKNNPQYFTINLDLLICSNKTCSCSIKDSIQLGLHCKVNTKQNLITVSRDDENSSQAKLPSCP